MNTFIFILIVVTVVLGLGMLKERHREKQARAWVAEHGGTLHWPFVPAQNPALPARELTLNFETQGSHQWAAAIEHAHDGHAVWLIEYSATPAGHNTGRWHSLLAEACKSEADAKRICSERNESAKGEWASHSHWIAKRDIGLISTSILNELTTLILLTSSSQP